LSARGIIFISADYRLTPPGTVYNILTDVKDTIAFVAGDLNVQLDQELANLDSGSHFRIDPTSIGVAGTSAGGYCAYLCAIYAVPKPKAVLSLYGMGGDLLVCPVRSPLNIFNRINTTYFRQTNISLPRHNLSSGGESC
jgi:acetyl esterase/lipase